MDPTATRPAETASFRAAIDRRESFATIGGLTGLLGAPHRGSAPSPFDAVDGARLAGPDGTHPLALIDAAELVAGPTDGLDGGIELEGTTRVGDGISGRIRITARRDIGARGASFRLVGVRLAEQTMSVTRTVSTGSGTPPRQETERWVEVHGSDVDSLPFTQPVLPAQLSAGQAIDLPFTVPAPRLGPPSAHAGTVLIAWALEAKWDIGMGSDERVSVLVDVRQHPDLLRAGVVPVGLGAMDDVVSDAGASLSITPPPPVTAGSVAQLGISWPGAPDGRAVRVELTADVAGPASLSVTPVSLSLDPAVLKAGTTIGVPIPTDAPPTFEGAGVKVDYRLRVIVDRPMRADASAERRVVVC